MNLKSYIDHTKLGPIVTKKDVEKLCLEAKEYGFKAVCVSPVWVSYAKKILKDSPVLVATVIGFPHGANLSSVKAFETKEAYQDGADEFDMVINVAALKEGNYQLVLDDIKAVLKAALGKTVKVIIETCYLTEEEIIKASQLALEAKANFVKTSTGFGPRGASVKDIEIIDEVLKGQIEIKASGGIKTYEEALEMIEAGATRIGASKGIEIINGGKKMIPTPHIELTDLNKIAKTVLMPGDPLRAKHIAETYLTEVEQINGVRNMFGYTGKYKGKKVTVMGSGMGMPSIGIYSYELYSQYGVENIIRVGSAGSYSADLNVYDVVLVTAAASESSYAKTMGLTNKKVLKPTKALNNRIEKAASRLDIPIHQAVIHSSDVFYRLKTDGYKDLMTKYDVKCVEMESFALFANAKALGKKAACLLTISDSFVTNEVTTAKQRQNSFNKMIEIALESLIK